MKTSEVSSHPFLCFEKQRERLKFPNGTTKKTKTQNKALIAGAAALGAIAPLVLFNGCRGKFSHAKDVFTRSNGKLSEKMKAIGGFVEVDGLKQIAISITGSVLGGLISSVPFADSEEEKEAKYKEGIYKVLNCIVPMSIIAGVETLAQKAGKKTSLPVKAATVAAGIGGGMLASNKIANKINKTLFHKEDPEKHDERKIKPTDFLVHLDDILGLAIVSKVPYANQIGKILPVIYAQSGYEAGCKEPKEAIK